MIWVWHLSGLMCVKRILSVLLFGQIAARPKAYYYAVDHGNLLELWESETQANKLISMFTVLTLSGLVFQMAMGEKLRKHQKPVSQLLSQSWDGNSGALLVEVDLRCE